MIFPSQATPTQHIQQKKNNRRCTETDHFLQSNQDFAMVLTTSPTQISPTIPNWSKRTHNRIKIPSQKRLETNIKRKNVQNPIATTNAREKNLFFNRESATTRKMRLSEGGEGWRGGVSCRTTATARATAVTVTAAKFGRALPWIGGTKAGR